MYDAPVGTEEERKEPELWPGKWISSNGYGNHYQFPDGTWAYHPGDDLNLNYPTWNSDSGKPVYACADGEVIYAQLVIRNDGSVSTWGRLVVIRHKGDIHTRYGHLRTLNVSKGDTVTRGQQIGTIGGTEYGLADHLHLDISDSGILENVPTYWPGDNLDLVHEHFVDPVNFITERH